MKIIDKLAWLYVRDRKVIFVRSRGKETFYTVGGKRQTGENDEQALTREVKEELGVVLAPASIRYLQTFEDQAHGQEEMQVKLTCYSADFRGTLTPSSEIEEIAWLNTKNTEKTTLTGKRVIEWLHQQNLVD